MTALSDDIFAQSKILRAPALTPLSQAAYWVALRDGAQHVTYLSADGPWAAAFDLLLVRLSAGEVRLVGRCEGKCGDVPTSAVKDCSVSLPFDQNATPNRGEASTLKVRPYIDHDAWEGGIYDELLHAGEKRWTHLQVSTEELDRFWPPTPDDREWLREAYIDVRSELLEKAICGKLTPQCAEAQALELGVGPLASKPAAEHLDPQQEPFWTLPMAAAWIAWRDVGMVQEQMKEFCEGWWLWRHRIYRAHASGDQCFEEHQGWVLEQQEPPSLLRLQLQQTFDAEECASGGTGVTKALRELSHSLQEGRLIAEGLDTETRRRAQITPSAWRDLTLLGEDCRPNAVRVPNDKGNAGHGFDDVVVLRSQVFAVWPESEKRHISSAGVEKRARRWLADFMRASPSQKALTRREAEALAHSQFPHLGHRAFQRAWTGAIQDAGAFAWSSGGRPKNRSEETGPPEKL